MTLKKYKIYRLIIVMLLSILISASISLQNYYLPIIFTLIAGIAMYYCYTQVQSEQVLADERDYHVAGKASYYTIQIYSWIGVLGAFILMAIPKGQGFLYLLGQYLALSVCFLMFLYVLLFKYLSKKDN